MNEELRNLILKEFNSRFPKKQFIAGQSTVPVSGKIFDENEIYNMIESVLDGWWTEGKYGELFSNKLAKWLGTKFAILCNSGSSANLLAFSALTSNRLGKRMLRQGDEVITVAAGFPTTINPIIINGMIPVFVDIDIGTYNANFEQIKQAISSKTKAIFLAHTLGNPYELDQIKKLCEENNLWFIEDNCDALGATFNNKKTGTFGHLATCSFYPAHHITTAEGGAIFTNNPILRKIIESMRDWGRDCWCKTGQDNTCSNRFCWQLGKLPYGYDHKYTYSEIGYNLKLTEMQAALGLAQLEKLDNFIEKRKTNFNYLFENLKKYEDFFILPKFSKKASPSWFGFLLTLRDGLKFSRTDLLKYLNEKKIGTRLLFAGNITKQPYFTNRNIKYKTVNKLPNTDKVMNDTFWIGVYPGINKEMLDYIIDSFNNFLKKYK
jgi:CDP-6-deoxy-D-xylo-4-hexulose-3-dehydrase